MALGVLTIGLAGVNSYLVTADDGFVLIDTGKPEKRAEFEAVLARAGCKPGRLKLIVLTHGDYDHAGNAAYLRGRYTTTIALHRDEAGKVERADWTWNMKAKPDKFGPLFRVVSVFVKPGPFDTFEPDIYLQDEQSLSGYGLDARIVYLPGHTKGSVGILTSDGDLFCGDLMDNTMGRPSLEFFIDDMAAAKASLEKLRRLRVDTVYPGHGKPFLFERVRRSR